jgi:general stress protein 26
MQHTYDFGAIAEAFAQRIRQAVWCNAATIDRQGRPRSRVIHPIWDGTVGYVTSAVRTAKLQQIAAVPWISLAYIMEPFRPTYIECAATVQNDRETRHMVWDLFAQTPEPLGGDLSATWGAVDNPDYVIVRLEPWRIELYDLLHQDQRIVWERGGL